MKFNKSSNPSFGRDVFRKSTLDMEGSETMTIEGAANKTLILVLLATVSASLTWKMFFSGAAVESLMGIGLIGGLIFALVSIFSKKWVHITAPAYAIFEGLFLGGLSAVLESVLPGVVMQAVGLTFGVFVTMLLLYKFRVIQPTKKFRAGLMAAMGGILLMYLVTFILRMFGVSMAFMHDGGMLGIGISLVIVAIAALNFILDFGEIEEGAAMKAPKQMEWYGAFGLMLTLVWLYISLLRLVAIISGD